MYWWSVLILNGCDTFALSIVISSGKKSKEEAEKVEVEMEALKKITGWINFV